MTIRIIREEIMKARIKGRHAVLGVASVAALVSAIAGGAPAAQSVPAKKIGNAAVHAAPAGEEMVSRLIVKHRARRSDKLDSALKATDTSGLAISSALQMSILRPMSGGAHVIKLDQPVTLTEARAIAERLKRDSEIELAEPDQIMRPMAAVNPSDPAYTTHQWHYKPPLPGNLGGANLPEAWGLNQDVLGSVGTASIRVAVLDTGYRQHEDFGPSPGNILPGYDFISNTTLSNDNDGRDPDAKDTGDYCSTDDKPKSSWHGTHVVGTIGAAMNNTINPGVDKPHGTGIAPKTSILPVRVIGRCGGLTSDIVDGMRWAAGIAVPGAPANENPAQVLNMSLGGSGACSASFQSAVNDITGAEKSIVVAAGNDGAIGISQPANCNGVIAVTAHAVDGDNAVYSNIGMQATISAPGGGCGFMSTGCSPLVSPNGLGIYSLSNTGSNAPETDSYGVKQGTSMATPHVSGVIALMLALKPTLTPAQIKSYLQSSARPHPAGTTCTQSQYTGLCGEGLLDGFQAVSKANDHAPIVSLANAYQVVAPNESVWLSSTATPAPRVEPARTIDSYEWTQQSGASVGAINGRDSANASFSAPMNGTYTFRLTVTDNEGKTGSATATVRVNSPPVLTPVPDQTVPAGSTVTFVVGATDAEGDAVSFSAETLPHADATLNPTTGAFSWPNAMPGTYALRYRANDRDSVSPIGTVNITVTGGGSGGGGSLDAGYLAGLAFLAAVLRVRRSNKKVRQSSTK
jgi:serine protease